MLEWWVKDSWPVSGDIAWLLFERSSGISKCLTSSDHKIQSQVTLQYDLLAHLKLKQSSKIK